MSALFIPRESPVTRTTSRKSTPPTTVADKAGKRPAEPGAPETNGHGPADSLPERGTARTATYLSQESLTFPGMTGVASIFVLIYTKVTNSEATSLLIVLSAVAIGILLTVIGLLDPNRQEKGKYHTFVQIVIGLFNTALLAAAILGISTVVVAPTP